MPEFGNIPGRDRCLQTLSYTLRIKKADDIAAGFPIPMYKITGTVNETRRCESKLYVDTVVAAGGSVQISNTQFPPDSGVAPTCLPPPKDKPPSFNQNCPNKDEIKQSSQGITNAVLNILQRDLDCDTVTPGCLDNLRIDGECRYDLGPCGGLFGFEQGGYDPDTGTFNNECNFTGPFDMKQEGFPGLDFTPGTDIPFGLIPQNVCDYSNYNTNCNLFEFIAEELQKEKPPAKINGLVQTIIETYLNAQTGGAFSVALDLISIIKTAQLAYDYYKRGQAAGNLGDAAFDLLEDYFGSMEVNYEAAIQRAYANYLNCLRSELSV